LHKEDYHFVNLQASSEMALIGKQYQEQVIYETKLEEINLDQIENETQIGPEIVHEYKLLNKGPSQISKSEMIITWQKKIKINSKNEQFLYLMEMPHTEGPIECQLDNSIINPLNISVS
jgi:hypothetical protein